MTIALILVEIFTVIMQRNVCEKAFDRKPAGTAVQFMVWAAFYIISNVTTYFFELPSWLNMVIFSVTFFGVLTWLYEGSIRIKLVLVLFLCLIGMLSEVMVCFIGILCGIDIIHMMGNTEVAIMYTILSKLVWFVEIKIALLFLKKNKNIVIRNMDWLEVFIVPVSSVFIVMVMFVPLTDEYVWAKLIASILILIVNLFTFYNYNELQEKALYQAERQFLTQQVENYAVQLQEMSKTWQQAREYRHDMKQRYLLIESYLNRNEYEKIRELYQQSVETLTEEELSSIFPCRFRYYTVNWAIGGTTGAGDLYEYDADGNTKQLGSFGIDDSYRTREEINPNWPEIDGSWRIEAGKLIRTITSGNQEKRYIVKSLDRDGYYLLCFESATGEVNAVMMIVLYDENNMPLYEFTEN